MVELTHATHFVRLMVTSARKPMSRVDSPEREGIVEEAGATYLPDKAPESLEDFLKSGADGAKDAQDKLKGSRSDRERMQGESAYAMPS